MTGCKLPRVPPFVHRYNVTFGWTSFLYDRQKTIATNGRYSIHLDFSCIARHFGVATRERQIDLCRWLLRHTAADSEELCEMGFASDREQLDEVSCNMFHSRVYIEFSLLNSITWTSDFSCTRSVSESLKTAVYAVFLLTREFYLLPF